MPPKSTPPMPRPTPLYLIEPSSIPIAEDSPINIVINDTILKEKMDIPSDSRLDSEIKPDNFQAKTHTGAESLHENFHSFYMLLIYLNLAICEFYRLLRWRADITFALTLCSPVWSYTDTPKVTATLFQPFDELNHCALY